MDLPRRMFVEEQPPRRMSLEHEMPRRPFVEEERLSPEPRAGYSLDRRNLSLHRQMRQRSSSPLPAPIMSPRHRKSMTPPRKRSASPKPPKTNKDKKTEGGDKKVWKTRHKRIWLIGTAHLQAVEHWAKSQTNLNLGLDGYDLMWHCKPGVRLMDVFGMLTDMKTKLNVVPDYILLHVGGTEFEKVAEIVFKKEVRRLIKRITQNFKDSRIIWVQLIPDTISEATNHSAHLLNKRRNGVDDHLAEFVLQNNGCYIRLQPDLRNESLFHLDDEKGTINLTEIGCEDLMVAIKTGIIAINQRGMRIHPDLKMLPRQCQLYVNKHRKSFTPKKQWMKLLRKR